MPGPLRDVPQEAVELLKSFEGIVDGDPSTVNLDAYLDPLGIWTIGWGHAVRWRGQLLRGAGNRGLARALYPGGITRAQAEALLKGDLVEFASNVQALVKVPLADRQFGALVSFAFNVGVGALAKSTLLRRLNERDFAAAAEQFLVWNKGRKNGVLIELPGLTRRRRAERALFLGLDWRAASALTRSLRAGAAARAAAKNKRRRAAGTPVKRRARTTTPKAPPKPRRAARPAPRKGR